MISLCPYRPHNGGKSLVKLNAWRWLLAACATISIIGGLITPSRSSKSDYKKKTLEQFPTFYILTEHPRRWRNCIPHPPWSIIISISVWWSWIVPVIRYWQIFHLMTIVALYVCWRMPFYPQISLFISSKHGNFSFFILFYNFNAFLF